MIRPKKLQRPRAVIYTRLSDIGPGGRDTVGLDRQQVDCEQFAKHRGFDVVMSFREEGVSATRGAKRAQFASMLLYLDAGRADVVLAWRLDRLTRSSRDLERFLDVAQRERITLYLTHDGTEAKPDGSMLFLRLGAVIAAEESRTIGLRVARSKLERARTGRHTGGGPRPYGWTTAEKTKSIAAERKMIRELVKRVIAGESCHAIAVDWNERKIASTRGGRWNSSQLYSLVRSPRYAGKVLYQRKSNEPQLFPAGWQSFISASDWVLVELELARRANEPKNGGFHGRRHLLSGLLVCAGCGYKLLAWKGNSERPAVYMCQRRTEHPERCGRTTMLMSDADLTVAELTLRALRDPVVIVSVASGTGSSAVAKKQGRLRAIEVRRTRLEADVLTGKRQQTAAVRLALRDLAEEAETLSLELVGARVATGLKGRVIKSLKNWDRLGLLERRLILSGLFDAILVSCGRLRGPAIGRVSPIFVIQPVKPVRVDGRLILSKPRAPRPRRKGSNRSAPRS